LRRLVGALGDFMKSDLKDDSARLHDHAPLSDSQLAPYVALDRLLRYAHHEALSQNRAVAAGFIEAAIMSLAQTGSVSQH
jgi:hypothetical protein